jgi:zinc/manganese transport system ATP-binding protein
VGALITLDNVTCRYRGVTAVEGVSGAFAAGSLTAIVGPNGAGKTTLLRAIAGVHPLAAGAIERDGVGRVQIALLPQASRMERGFPINCADVVALGAWPQIGAFATLPDAVATKVSAALARVGLAGLEHRLVGALSAGQFQRLLWARLLVQDAHVLLLDEPTANVDAASELVFRDMLAEWQREGRSVVAVLHDLDLVREMFPTTMLLARRLVAWGPTEAVLSADNRRTARLAIDMWRDAA